MKFKKLLLLIGVLCMAAYSQVDTAKQNFWMMTYFINGSDYVGARVSFASDTTLLRWQNYNNAAPISVPKVVLTGANDNRMRDPMIMLDTTTYTFHYIWTVSWTGTVIGYANSKDLRNWSTQTPLPIGTTLSSYVCWAPEIFWDDIQSKWMILWSVSQSSAGNKSLYYVLTSDFVTFTAPKKFFDPGYTVIDGSLIKVANGRYYLSFKDETANKNIHFVVGKTPQGGGAPTGYTKGAVDTGWSVVSSTLTPTHYEGPCMVKAGGKFRLIADTYSTGARPEYASDNIDVATSPWPNQGNFLAGTGTTTLLYYHCNVIPIPRQYVMWMLYKKCLPPVLLTPANNAPAGTSGSLNLTWSVYPDTTADKAASYKVQVSTNSTFATTSVDDSSATTGTLAVSGLTTQTKYYWRVAGKNTAGGLGTWSTVRNFTTGTVGIVDQKAHYSALPAGTRGVLEVYQASGTRVAEFAYDASAKVSKSTLLNNAKAGLAKGCYTYRLRVDSRVVEAGSFIKK